MIQKKRPMGLFSSGSLRSRRLRSIRPQLRKSFGFLNIWVHSTTIVLSHHREGTCPAPARGRFGLWSLLLPGKNKNGRWEVGRLRIPADALPHDRLSTAAVNRKERLWQCPKHWNLTWPYFGLCLQAPRILGHLMTCTRTASCARGHVNILWYHPGLPVCLCVPQRSQRETLDEDPPSQRLTIWPCWVDLWCVLYQWLVNIEFSLVRKW